MADDASYLSFLNKANESTTDSTKDTTTTTSTTTSDMEENLVTTTSAPPRALAEAQYTFTSESDEPFEPVSMQLPASTSTPSELSRESFAQILSIAARDVEAIPAAEFESMGYTDVIATVRRVVSDDEDEDGAKGKGKGRGEVSVFKVQADHARVRWWVVGVREGVLLGVRAKAVES